MSRGAAAGGGRMSGELAKSGVIANTNRPDEPQTDSGLADPKHVTPTRRSAARLSIGTQTSVLPGVRIPTVDQRGLARPASGSIMHGAYQYSPKAEIACGDVAAEAARGGDGNTSGGAGLASPAWT
jgi:hypothetical protein